MRIDGISLPVARGLFAALPKAVSTFAPVESEPRAAPPFSPAGVTSTPSVQMLVMLAAAENGVERRRRQAVSAERGLGVLERLHGELLAGTPSVARLREVADWAREAELPDDPALAAIFREIDLRVRVELAKYDVEI